METELLGRSVQMKLCYACGSIKMLSEYTVYTTFTASKMQDQKQIICDNCAATGKVCSICHQFKLYVDFPKGTNRGKTAAFCKPCKNEYNKKHYDPEKHGTRRGSC